jgi:ABC-type antimicrobial peptide transport system permease subunit
LIGSIFGEHLKKGNFTNAKCRPVITSGAKVAIVSEDLARKMGGLSVLGRVFSFTDRPASDPSPQFQIIGIAPAFAETSMKERPYVVWMPLDKESESVTVVLRTSQPPKAILGAIRKTVGKIDSHLPMVETITMEEQISKGLTRERMFATVCSGFGILALVLSIVGLYGVIAYNTAKRRGEIGIRLVLGAGVSRVVRMIVREGMMLVGLGVLLGIPLIWLGARYVQKELFQMKPIEPMSVLLSLGTLLAAALAAVLIPAVRATMLQPAETLRQDC